jgi:hypothetical protein
MSANRSHNADTEVRNFGRVTVRLTLLELDIISSCEKATLWSLHGTDTGSGLDFGPT